MADATRKVNGFSPSDPQRGLGDNGGPPLKKLTAKGKVERIKEVLDMEKLSAAQKCVGIAIVCEADSDWITPELSTADLQRYASVKDRETVYRATRQLDERKVANAIKTEGRANRYVLLPSEAIDAALDEIDAGHQTGMVQPDPTGPMKPDGCVVAEPVGLNQTTPTSSNPTGQAEPDGYQAQDAPAHVPAPARDITRATKESPSGIVTSEELASKLASFLDAHAEKVAATPTELAGLNGSGEPMLVDVLSWLGPPTTIVNARDWLAGTVRAFGQEITVQSYHKLKTDLMTGAVVAKPLQTWVAIAQRMKAEPKTVAAKGDQPTRRERIRGYVEEAQAKLKAEKQKQNWSRS